ncbi:MAG: zonular occludens toxin domain-containing protein, partial [Methylobacter sp.]
GALIIVDEVQRIWRPTNGGAGPSEAISALETHRHYGLDFWLISQGPHLFHNFIRLLVGRHVHLVAKWSGRKEFEWPECKQDVQSRSDAVMRPYSLPKHVYDMYDSAEVHTVQEKRKPLSFYATIAALVLSVLMAGFVVKRIKDRMAPVEVAAAQSSPAPGAGPDTINPVTHEQSGAVSIDTPEKLQVAMTPIVPGVPWSAPFYKELVKPVSFPRIAGCIKSKKQGDFRCACYSQQGTIVEVPPDVCSLYVQRHAFNPFKPDSNAIEAKYACFGVIEHG